MLLLLLSVTMNAVPAMNLDACLLTGLDRNVEEANSHLHYVTVERYRRSNGTLHNWLSAQKAISITK